MSANHRALKECGKYFDRGRYCDNAIEAIIRTIHSVPLTEKITDTLKDSLAFFVTQPGYERPVATLIGIILHSKGGQPPEAEALEEAREWVNVLFRQALGELDDLNRS